MQVNSVLHTLIYLFLLLLLYFFSHIFFFPCYCGKANETTSGSTPGTHLQIITWKIT